MILTSTRSLFALATLALTAAAVAQSPEGTLRGTVLDPSGALIQQARITLIGADGVSRSLSTDVNGAFELAHLTPGGYSVSINAPGFTPALEAIEVEGNRITTEQVKLGISVLQEIDVTAN